MRSHGERVIYVAMSPSSDEAVVSWSEAEGVRELSAAEEVLPPEWAPEPQAIEFPSSDGRTAHAFWYPPRNPGYEGPPGELPPILVQSHGGPTAHASPMFDPEIAFWTSRGIGVVDVNYGGSTGFGRAYRELLNGAWGIVDVEDCVAAAAHLAEAGEADGRRLAIHGGSAGGYTMLCALAFHRRLRGRRQLLRRGRRRDARRRHAQVRVALPRLADRPLPRRGQHLPRSARRSTTSTGSARP